MSDLVFERGNVQEFVWGPASPGGEEGAPRTMTARVFRLIRSDITSGRIKPGTKLQVEPLKKKYGAGSSPLREALAHLAATGLVYAEDQRGFRVADVSLQELVDVTRLRVDLEISALRASLKLGDIEWEIAVSGAFQRLRHSIAELTAEDEKAPDRWEQTHRRFHTTVIGACGSPWTLHFCDRLYDQLERYRRIFVEHSNISPDILEEHEHILKAVLDRDEEKAVALLRKHVVMAAYLTEQDMRAQNIHDADQIPADVRKLFEVE